VVNLWGAKHDKCCARKFLAMDSMLLPNAKINWKKSKSST
jgi:hypothetical protein